ncbi:MAG: META domain-containing protein [Methanoregula sp.]|jgi:heat shock protein HslJ
MEPLKKNRKLPLLPVLAGLMILIPILFAAGCTGNTPVPPGPAPDGTRWTLTDYISDGTSLLTLNGTTVTLEFGNDGRITGSAGCNHYVANYEIKGTAITIGQAGSTEMYCTAPGVMEQESAYLATLSRAASVTTVNDRLTFADAKGTTILSFTKIVPPAPAPLMGTNWTLDSIYMGDAVSSVITGTTLTAIFSEDGRISGSAGCNNYFGSYTATGTSLSVSSIGSTKMNCPGRGIVLQESTYLISLGKTATFTISGNRLSLADANGATLLSFTRQD